MARKRQITVERIATSENSEEEIPKKYRDEGWSIWLKGTYAKWWYALICAMIDIFIALEISRFLSGALTYLVPLAATIVLVILEMYLYNRIWGGLEFIFTNRRLI